jgi:hypothetical protein
MRAVITPIGEQGTRYLGSSLREGLTLSRVIASRVAGLTTDVLTASVPPAERLLQFDRGGMGPSAVDVLGAWLKDHFELGILVIELPLWRPDDLASGSDAFQAVAAEGEVYAVASIGDDLNKLDATIRCADPAYMYHAMIFPDQSGRELLRRSDGWRERLADALVAVLVGAYDGEGFVLCRSPVRGPGK